MKVLELALNEEQMCYVEYASTVLRVAPADVVRIMIDECITENKQIQEKEKEIAKWKTENERNSPIC